MDDAVLIEQYKKGITLKQLSTLTNTSVDVVRLRLKKLKVYVQTKTYKYELPEQEICEAYKADISIEDIAKKFGVSVQPIVSILRSHNIRKPNRFKNLPYSLYTKVIDKEFFQAVISEHISKQNVGKALGLNYDMVASLYKYHKIPSEPAANIRSQINQRHASLVLSKDVYLEKYINEQMPVAEIAQLMGVSTGYLRLLARTQWNVLTQNETRLSREFKQIRNNKALLRAEIKTHSVKTLSKKYGVGRDTMKKALEMHSISIPHQYRSASELELEKLITSVLPRDQLLICDRKTIYPYELDFYIPGKKLAIEYCGLYWHSELQGKTKDYHITKHNRCHSQGIRLITIFEDEYKNNPDLVNNRILHSLGVFQGVKRNARQCTVKPINYEQKKNFLNQYHLQGNDVSQIWLGLFSDDQLIAVMTFSKPSRVRNSKKSCKTPLLWELNRYATHSGFHVRGAAGKLLSYFKKTNEWQQIYSYADRRWSQGTMYTQLGFTLASMSKPNYWYLSKGYYKREYRYNYAKYKLVQLGFDKNLTEFQIMESRGFTKIWDCGMLKFVMDRSSSV